MKFEDLPKEDQDAIGKLVKVQSRKGLEEIFSIRSRDWSVTWADIYKEYKQKNPHV